MGFDLDDDELKATRKLFENSIKYVFKDQKIKTKGKEKEENGKTKCNEIQDEER